MNKNPICQAYTPAACSPSIWALLSCFLLLQIAVAHGQQPAMKRYTIDDGLVQQQVTCLYKDSRGYLWVGTKGGVSRFDGQTFFNLDINDGLPSLRIIKILEDKQGYIWFATSMGLARYDGAQMQTYLFPPEWQQSTYEIDTDYEGNFYITRSKLPNIVTFSNGNYHIKYNFKDVRIFSVAFWDKPYYTLDSIGVFYLNDSTAVPVIVDSTLLIKRRSRDPVHLTWLQAEKDIYEEERIWNYYIVSPEGEKKWFYRSSSKTGLLVNTDQLVRDFYHFIDGRKKILRYHPERSVPDTINLNQTIGTRLWPEDRNTLWIGTEEGLIQCFVDKNIQHFEQEKMDYVWSIVEDQEGDLWFPRYHQGMTRMRGDSIWEDTSFLSAIPSIYSPFGFYFGALQDQQNDLYFPMDSGVLRKKNDEWSLLRSNLDGTNNTFLWMWEDYARQQLVLGGKAGIQILKDGVFVQYFGSEKGIHNCSYIVSGIDDCDGNYWLGSYYGLSHLNPDNGQVRSFTRNANTLPDQGVISILRDSWGEIWFGGVQNLMTYDALADSFIVFPLQEQMGTISALVETDNEQLFVGCQFGVLVIDLAAYHQNGAYRYHVINRFNGYRGKEVNQNTLFKDSKGSIWAGSSTLTARFDAQNLKPDTTSIRPVVGALNRNPLPFLFTDRDTFFTVNSKNIELAFHAIGYNRPWENEYSYFLDGYSKKWSSWSTSSSVNFSNLSSGDYTLQLRTRTPGTLAEPTMTILQLRIDLPFGEEPYFLGFVAAVLSILLLSALYGYLATQRSKQKLAVVNEKLATRNEEINHLHRERKHRITNDFIILKQATKKERAYATDEEQTKIMDRLLQRIDAIRALHHHLNPDNQIKQVFLNEYLQDIVASHLVLFRRGRKTPLIQLEGMALLICSDSALHLGIIVNELLTNGIKYVIEYTKDPLFCISYIVEADQLLLQYTDNGPGMDYTQVHDQGSGTGNYLIRTSTLQLNGQRSVVSSKQGLSLSFTFPLAAILPENRNI